MIPAVKSEHRRYEVQLTKNGGEHWYPYAVLGGYVRSHITDEHMLKHLYRRYNYLVDPETCTEMRVIRIKYK